MPFSTASITSGPNAEDDGAGTLVWWESSGADDIFQLYADRTRVWSGTARFVTLPRPGVRVVYQVGTVDPGEEEVDFADDLPALQGGGDRALLSWIGGPWQEPSPGSGLAGFRVYGEASPGRRFFLRLRLKRLQSQSEKLAGSGAAQRRAGSPPLRLIHGGQNEPPKDKRYLN